MASPAEARALLRRVLVLPMTRVEGHVGLAEGVAEERISGSWWAHPSGEEIFAIAEALGAMPDVLTAKLLAGTTTFIDSALWPAIARVVADRGRRDRAMTATRPLVQWLVRTVESGVPVRADQLPKLAPGYPRPQLNEAKEELETRLLVHVTRDRVYRSWLTWMSPDTAARGAILPLESARDQLRAAARACPIPMLDV